MNDKIEAILKNPKTIPTLIGALSFGGGVGLGYFLAKRKLQEEAEMYAYDIPKQLFLDFDPSEKNDDISTDIVEEEVTEPVRPPKVVITEEVAVSKDILKVDSLSQLRPSMLGQDDPDEKTEKEIVNVFEEQPEIVVDVTDEIEWDWETEVGNRTESAPYVLHKDEFYADEKNYSQQSLTFYSVDEILADEEDHPVYNHALVLGPMLFGHGSGDPNVVYIRNDERRAEYEITKVDGLYSVEVLGLEIENNERVADIKHSRQPTKFRMD